MRMKTAFLGLALAFGMPLPAPMAFATSLPCLSTAVPNCAAAGCTDIVGSCPLQCACPTPGNPGHDATSFDVSSLSDSGGWLYHSLSTDPQYGGVQVDCIHTTERGTVWADE